MLLATPACRRNDEARSKGAADKATPEATNNPKELTGEARGRRMQLEARNCIVAPAAERPAACRLACELAHSNSCYYRGRQLELGDHVTVDLPRALARYRQGCKGGSGLACRGAASLYARGLGVSADAGRAAGLYKSARNHGRVHCEQGHAASCLAIGEMFQRGEGGPPDVRAAFLYLQRACHDKLEAACTALEGLRK